MLINMAPIHVGAIDVASFIASSVETYAGNGVNVEISGNSLADLGSFDLEIYYDSTAMSVDYTSNGWLVGDSILDVNTDTEGVVKVSAISLSGISGSGTFLNIYFSIDPDCEASEYPVQVTVGEAYDTNLNPVSITGGRGIITVKRSEESAREFYIYTLATLSYASIGDKITYRVYNGYNYGFASGNFAIEYDPDVLQIESVELNENMSVEGCVYDINTNQFGRASISIASNVELRAYELITATFTVIKDENTNTVIETTASDMYDDDLSEFREWSSNTYLTIEKLPETIDCPNLYLKDVQDMVVGNEYKTTLSLESGAPVAAADFVVNYDTSVFECVSVNVSETASSKGAMLMINDKINEGSVRFSYINQEGYADGIDLIDIVWKVKTAPSQHYEMIISGSGVKTGDFQDLQLEYVKSSSCISERKVVSPTCTKQGYTEGACYCGKFFTTEYVAALGHTEIVDEAVVVSCTEYGLTEGKHCSVCGEVLLKQEIIPALGHTEVIDETVEPTCTENGLTEGKYCTVCEEVLLKQEEIPALGHTEVIDEAVAPDCVNIGFTEGVHCSVCEAVLLKQEEIPALGHTEIVDEVIEPTCSETGLTEGKHCSACKEVLVEQTVVDALGHSFTEYILNGDGTKTAKCDRCDEISTVNDEIYGGVYGENLTWFIDSTDTLYIKGIGEMETLSEEIPWKAYAENIKEVVIVETITTIASNAFADCFALEEITIHENMISVGEGAFKGCTALARVVISGMETTIGIGAFDHNTECCFVVNKDSEAFKWLVENGFTNFDAKVMLEELALPASVKCVLGESVELQAEMVPDDESVSINLTWASENPDIAVVDEETGTITAVGLGETKVTVTDGISGLSAATMVTIKLPAKEKLTAAWDELIDKSGLQAGETRQMTISGSSVGELPAKYFEFKSSNENAVTVDENGTITVVFAGSGTATASATITATVKGDATKKVTFSVKAIPKQSASVDIIVECNNEAIGIATNEDGVQMIIVPRSLVKEGTLPINLKAVAKDADGNAIQTNVKWTSDATNVAKVVAAAGTKDSAIATIGKNVDGIAVITATTTDLKKIVSTIEIDVRDYTPRLEANSITLNTFKTGGESVKLYTAYDAILQDYSMQMALLVAEETRVTEVNLEGKGSENFYAVYDGESGTIIFNAAEVVKNGTYPLTLHIFTAEGITSQPVTLKVANKLPKVTIKQASTFELFYKNSTSEIAVTATDSVNTKEKAPIKAITMAKSDTFVSSEYDAEADCIMISYLDQDDPLSKFVGGKTADTKVDLIVEFEGYRESYLKKDYTLKAKETKAALGQSRTSTKYTAFGNDNTPINIINAKTKELIDISSCRVRPQDSSADYVTVSKSGTSLVIMPMLNADGKFEVNDKVSASHTAKIDVQDVNWIRPITISHAISVNTAVPTVKLKNASLKLNSAFDTQAETQLIPSSDNCLMPIWTVIPQPTKTQTVEIAKLNVAVSDWKVNVGFADINNLPAKGSYKFVIAAKLGGVDLKPVTLVVSVAETLPSISLTKTSVKLNKQIAEDVEITKPFKIPVGYEVVDVLITNSKGNVLTTDEIVVTYDRTREVLAVKVKNKALKNGSYKYDITPIVKLTGESFTKEAMLKKAIVFTVSVFSGSPSVTYSAKGKIDLVNRDEGIIYTLTKGTNFVYDATDVNTNTFVLTGADADKFTIEYLGKDAKNQHMVEVKAKPDALLKKGAKYSYNIAVAIEGIAEYVSMAKNVSVTTTQTALKVTVKGGLMIYQSFKGTNHFSLSVAAPSGAQIADVKLLDTKATTVPKDALEYSVSQNADGSFKVSYTVKKASKVKVNKTYKLAMEITPAGNGENVKPQVVTVTFKVKR